MTNYQDYLSKTFFVHVGTTAYKDLELENLYKLGYQVLILDDLGFKPADNCCHTYIYEQSKETDVLAKIIKDFSEKTGLKLGHLFTMAEGSVDLLNDLCLKLSLPPVFQKKIASIRDKYEMRRRLFEYGISIPYVKKVTNESDLQSVVNESYPLIVKPVDSLDSRSVSLVNNRAELVSACEKVFQNKTQLKNDFGYVSVEDAYQMKPYAVIETFVDGPEYDVDVVVINGEVIHKFVTLDWNTGAPHFYDRGQTSGLQSLNQQQEAKLDQIIKALIEVNQYNTTLLHIEFRVTSDQDIFFIECNSRLCGDQISDLISKSYGINLLDLYFRYIQGLPPLDLTTLTPKIFTRFYIITEEQGHLRLKASTLVGHKIKWWKPDNQLIKHLDTVRLTRIGSIEFESKSAQDLQEIELQISQEIASTYAVI